MRYVNNLRRLGLGGAHQQPSMADIRTAYRQAALTAHPNKGGRPEDFRQLHEAYERLQHRSPPRRRHHPKAAALATLLAMLILVAVLAFALNQPRQ